MKAPDCRTCTSPFERRVPLTKVPLDDVSTIHSSPVSAQKSRQWEADITGCGSTRVILGSRPTAREFCRSTRKTSSLLSGATKVTSKSDCTPTCAMEGGSETFDYYR